MLVSSVIAFSGIGLAWFFFVQPAASAADAVAASAGAVHRLLLNKY